jgi:hypothetical protein
MYELLSVGLIPNLHAEGTAFASGLTVLGAIWLAVSVILCLVVVPLSFHDAGVGGITDDAGISDVTDDERRNADFRRAA